MADTYKVKHRQHRLLDSGHNGVVFPVVMLQLSDTNPTKFDQGMFVILKEIFLEMIEELDAIVFFKYIILFNYNISKLRWGGVLLL